MKIFVAAVAILSASTSIGLAADLAMKAPPVPAPVWSWTGFYIGGHVGAGWGTTETTLTSLTGAGVGPLVGGIALTQNDRSGFVGGGQLGYNYQAGWAVVGVQGDIAALGINGTTPCLGVGASCTAKSDWLASVTGRIGGILADHTLVYVKGGAAWLNTSHSLAIPAGLGPTGFSVSADSTTFGWLLGMGAEYAFTPNWSAFIEYDYIDFDKANIALNFSQIVGTPAVANVDVKNKLSIAKIGLNYKFSY